jgi:hypothetical protein
MNKILTPFRAFSTALFFSLYLFILYKSAILGHAPTYIDVLVIFTHTVWWCAVITTKDATNYRDLAVKLLFCTLLIVITLEDIEKTTTFMGEPIFEYYAADFFAQLPFKIASGSPANVFESLTTTLIYDYALKVEYMVMMLMLLVGTLSSKKVKKLL